MINGRINSELVSVKYNINFVTLISRKFKTYTISTYLLTGGIKSIYGVPFGTFTIPFKIKEFGDIFLNEEPLEKTVKLVFICYVIENGIKALRIYEITGLDSDNNYLYIPSKVSNKMALGCNRDEYFDLNSRLCIRCTTGFVFNKSCVTTGCSDDILANSLGYCPDEGINYYDPGVFNLFNNEEYTQPANCQHVFVNNKCIDCTTLSPALIKHYKYCVSNCPPGFLYSTDPSLTTLSSCIKKTCPSGVYNYIKNSCVVCPDGERFDMITESCTTSCSNIDHIQGDSLCDCAEGYYLRIDPNNESNDTSNQCIPNTTVCDLDIVTNIQYKTINSCVNSSNPFVSKYPNNCSKYYTYNSMTKFCEPICISPNDIGYNNSCVSSCPSGYTLKTISTIKICSICNNYIYLNQCVITCPQGTENDDVNKVCIACSNLSKVYYAGDMKCYDPNQCPKLTQLYNNECVNCSNLSPNLYYHSVDKTCYQTCPDLYEADNVLMKCVKCSSYTPS